MNKKQKLIFYLIVVVLLIFLVNKILNVKDLNYTIRTNDKKFAITESYNNQEYKIKILNDKYIYDVNIYKDLKKKRKIVNNIYHYSDGKYNCILPIINNRVLTDIMCYKNGTVYNYNILKGKDTKLDKFAADIEEYINYKNYDTYKEIDTLKFYDNKIDNIVSITSYKGIYVNGMPINIFKKDVYSNKINIYVDKYYLSADYNQNHEFNSFYLVNLENREIEKIELKNSISFDSYIQGIVNNKVYVYDYDNEVQYEIDVESKKVSIVSSKNYIKYYTNTKWERLSKSKVKRSTYFDYSTLNNNFKDYDYIKETEDYYYLFNKNINNYKLYRVNKNNIDIKTYIGNFPTTDIKMKEDYFYYINNNKLYYYSDITGLKVILENSEIEFNESIKYYIY